MEIQEKRSSRRLKVNLPVTFEQLGEQHHVGETVTRDISLTGLRMNMDTFSATESNYLVRVRFPEVSRIIEAMAKVAWSHRISYSDQYQAGFQFYEINPVFKKWLEEYILVNEALSR